MSQASSSVPNPSIAYAVLSDLPRELGPILLCANAQGLTAVQFARTADSSGDLADFAVEPAPSWQRSDTHPVLDQALTQLRQYFVGQRQVFQLPLAAHGTAFQARVWDELIRIPYATTTTYQRIAESLGQPSASRAVGLANGRNPLGIIVPCHRVIGSSGQLTGYAGGLTRKRLLLDLEQRHGGSVLSFAWP